MRPPRLPLPDDLFAARFHVLRAISSGAVGAVYEARDLRTARLRALKILLPNAAMDDDARERFDLEARVTAKVRSPHVVEVVDAGVDDDTGLPFLVMELLDGETLGEALARGPFSIRQALDVLREIARGLDAMHAAGVVHRDVKPENVMLARDTSGAVRAVLVDLGVAKVFAGGPVATTRAVGTPLYMAPEQIEGCADVDGRADVYAIAHVAFAMLVGKPYFAAEHARGALYRVLLDAARGLPEAASVRARRAGVALPSGFDAWFDRMTSRDRRKRAATAGEAVGALERALVEGSARKRVPVIAAACAVLAIGAAASFGGKRAVADSTPRAHAVTAVPSNPATTDDFEGAPNATVDADVAPLPPSPPPTSRPPSRHMPLAKPHAAAPPPAASSATPALPRDPTDVR